MERRPTVSGWKVAQTGGELRAEVRSGDSRLILDAQRPAGILIPGPRGRCSLTFRFRSAEGGAALCWEEIS